MLVVGEHGESIRKESKEQQTLPVVGQTLVGHWSLSEKGQQTLPGGGANTGRALESIRKGAENPARLWGKHW